MSHATSSVGVLVQQWRKSRRLSQLALAAEASVSLRHLCFIEYSGRCGFRRHSLTLLCLALLCLALLCLALLCLALLCLTELCLTLSVPPSRRSLPSRSPIRRS